MMPRCQCDDYGESNGPCPAHTCVDCKRATSDRSSGQCEGCFTTPPAPARPTHFDEEDAAELTRHAVFLSERAAYVTATLDKPIGELTDRLRLVATELEWLARRLEKFAGERRPLDERTRTP